VDFEISVNPGKSRLFDGAVKLLVTDQTSASPRSVADTRALLGGVPPTAGLGSSLSSSASCVAGSYPDDGNVDITGRDLREKNPLGIGAEHPSYAGGCAAKI
jgi:hypothetical protein